MLENLPIKVTQTMTRGKRRPSRLAYSTPRGTTIRSMTPVCQFKRRPGGTGREVQTGNIGARVSSDVRT